MKVWTVHDEGTYGVVESVFLNEHAAIEHVNRTYGYHTWYQIKEHWWRGYRGHDGSAYSVLSHDVQE